MSKSTHGLPQEPSPTTGSDRLHALAASLDALTEDDLCVLCNITPGTADNWRRRHQGPSYTLIGNRVLYPRTAVAKFMEAQLRERSKPSTKDTL